MPLCLCDFALTVDRADLSELQAAKQWKMAHGAVA